MAENALTQKAAEVIGQLQSLAPKATEISLQAVSYGGVADLISGVIVAATLYPTYKLVRLAAKNADDGEPLAVVALLALGIWALFAVICLFMTLLNPWTYVAIWHPDIAVAHQIISAASK